MVTPHLYRALYPAVYIILYSRPCFVSLFILPLFVLHYLSFLPSMTLLTLLLTLHRDSTKPKSGTTFNRKLVVLVESFISGKCKHSLHHFKLDLYNCKRLQCIGRLHILCLWNPYISIFFLFWISLTLICSDDVDSLLYFSMYWKAPIGSYSNPF